jgi:hypothetical protein
MRHLKKKFRHLKNLKILFLICIAGLACFPTGIISTALAATHTSAEYQASPPFISRGVKPNVLIIIDNSNSMDEDVVGNAVGSAAPNSRSEIARQAIISLIDANADRMNFGLMAYEQSGVSRYELHNSFYYCSYDPTTYDPTGTPTPKDPSTNTMRYPNPTDPGNYVYYDQALPMYDGSNQGNAFAYCSNFIEDGVGSTANTYWIYGNKTGLTDPPSGSTQAQLTASYGYATLLHTWGLVPTDEDYAAGFTEFGEQLSWVYSSPTWFANSSPGEGHLHVPVTDSTSTHLTALHEKLGTSNFSTNTADHPNNDLDTPLRNAGLTPIEGTLESCRNYFEGVSSPVTNWCQKNFVILVTDGLPSVDKNGTIGDADILLPGVETEVQLLRTTNVPGFTDDFDIQTFVLGFALSPGLGSKLDDIAIAGGTDEDGHAYIAGNQAELAVALQKIFLEILNRASSGSAASVISNSRSGEGAIYQSIFFPELRDSSGNTAYWTGDIHALLVDKYGNMREDTNDNQQLDEASDNFVVYYDDLVTNTTKAHLYSPVDGSDLLKTPDLASTPASVEITDLSYLWSGMEWLSNPVLNVTDQRNYAAADNKRYIFTDNIDTSTDVSTGNVENDQVMDFIPDFVDDATHDNYFFLNPEDTGMTEAQMITEAQNIIKFTRGQEGLNNSFSGTAYRNRTLVDSSGNDKIYRLGDIIHSTPTVVSRPAENYDLLYNDSSYLDFKKKYVGRRMMVYSGANDGMLHAFNGGFYNSTTKNFITQPQTWNGTNWVNDTSYTGYSLGMELWGYVPNAILPHLRWLTEPSDYSSHVYYVDLKPRIFDAKIFSADATHPGGWGTVLLGGMRLGGGDIGVDTDNDGTDDIQFHSTYFALDITDPESAPTLLWSFTDSNLGFTTCYPTPIRVGSEWFIVIGSGPVDYEATRKDDGIHFTEYGGSNRTASVYILNADDGTLAHTFTMDGHSFMADPIAADFDLVTSGGEYDREWSGEAIYIASDGCGA